MGPVGVSVDASVFETDGYKNVLQSAQRASRHERGRQLQELRREARLQPDRSRARVRAHRILPRGTATTGRSRLSDPPTPNGTTRRGSTRAAVSAFACQTRASSRRPCSPTSRRSPATSSRFRTRTGRARTGRLTLNQTVPTDAVGGWRSGRARSARAMRSRLARDFRWVDGDSLEDAFDATLGATKTSHRVAGGTQRASGLFVQDVFTPVSRLTVTASARVDRWRNYDAHNTETTLATGAVSDPVLAVEAGHGRQRPARRAVPGVRPHLRLGRRCVRLPRAHAQRALSAVLGRRRRDPRQPRARPGASARWRSSASTSSRGRSTTVAHDRTSTTA